MNWALILQVAEWAGAVLAIVGFPPAIYFGWDNIRRQTAGTKKLQDITDQQTEMTEQLALITNSVSTRFIGSFPGHLAKIAELIDGASGQVEVLTDCLDYGSFSEPQLYRNLMHAIGRFQFRSPASSAGKIKFFLCGRPQEISAANKWHDVSLHGTPEFNACMRDFVSGLTTYEPEFVKSISREFDTLRKYVDAEDTDWSAAIPAAAREKVQALLHGWVEKNLGDAMHAEILCDPKLSGADLFFWMADREKAVLLYCCPGKDALAFSTNDKDLVTRLGEIFDEKTKALSNASTKPITALPATPNAGRIGYPDRQVPTASVTAPSESENT